MTKKEGICKQRGCLITLCLYQYPLLSIYHINLFTVCFCCTKLKIRTEANEDAMVVIEKRFIHQSKCLNSFTYIFKKKFHISNSIASGFVTNNLSVVWTGNRVIKYHGSCPVFNGFNTD